MRETKYWVWHITAGLVVLLLLGAHMAIMHLGNLLRLVGIGLGDPLAFAQVAARGRTVLFMATYILLLGAALFHGLYGLRTILLELSLSPRGERGVTVGCWAAGAAFFLLGAWAAVASFRLAPGAG